MDCDRWRGPSEVEWFQVAPTRGVDLGQWGSRGCGGVEEACSVPSFLWLVVVDR